MSVIDIAVMMEMIQGIGFPIAICLLLFWYLYHMMENHKIESEKFTEAINNNTLVIQKLVDKLDGD